mmetsp:Transcript_19121/g.45583  ORF Transcript_19121/g.45583 Transcript_19121/m.45583 type:complete len:221 (-) Transcript_19121:2726-3388(-)
MGAAVPLGAALGEDAGEEVPGRSRREVPAGSEPGSKAEHPWSPPEELVQDLRRRPARDVLREATELMRGCCRRCRSGDLPPAASLLADLLKSVENRLCAFLLGLAKDALALQQVEHGARDDVNGGRFAPSVVHCPDDGLSCLDKRELDRRRWEPFGQLPRPLDLALLEQHPHGGFDGAVPLALKDAVPRRLLRRAIPGPLLTAAGRLVADFGEGPEREAV